MTAPPDGNIGLFDSPVVAHAKLVPPRVRAECVPRGDLVNRWLESPAQVAAIRGPAGSGKSTLMAQCHDAEPFAAWLSLDRADNDQVVLWWSLIESIREILDGFGQSTRDRLVIAGSAVTNEVVTSFANELGECAEPISIYVDDLQLLNDAPCRSSLHRLITQLPPNVRIAFASRDVPPVPMARLRAQGNLLEITQSDLMLSVDDARHLFDALGTRLDRYLVELLVTRTEGWAAGLQLAGLALARNENAAEFIDDFHGTDRAVAAYLLGEVLERLSLDEQRFMLETSALRRLSGELCDTVTGRTDSAERLHSLEESNGFVIPLDRVGTWFRYHHLYADLLYSELRRRHPTEVPDIHLRAFEWLRDAGQIGDAIHHALEAGLRRDAADLVCAHWWELINTGRLETARDLVGRFDTDEIMEHQPLAIAAAFVECLSGNVLSGRRFLDAADRSTYDGAPPDGAASMESSLALARATLALDGVDQALADGERAYALEPPGSQWRPLAALDVGLALVFKGDPERSMTFLREAAESVDPSIRCYALAELCLGHLGHGDLPLAMATADEAVRVVEDQGIEDLVGAATTYAAATLTSIASGDAKAAKTWLAAARRPMNIVSQATPMDAMHVEMLLAEAALELDEYDVARQYIDQATTVAATIPDTGTMAARLNELRFRLKPSTSVTQTADVDDAALTERELEVLRLVPLGLTTREIGEELFLSRNTIKTYLRRIYRKLDASSRTDAMRRARQLGLIPETQRLGPDEHRSPATSSG